MLGPNRESVAAAAGDVRSLLNAEVGPVGLSVESLLGSTFSRLIEGTGFKAEQEPLFLGTLASSAQLQELDIIAHERDGVVVLEIEPSLPDRPSAARLLASLRAGIASIQSASTIEEACREASEAVRLLTGFDRVVAYRFLDDDTGKVVAEAGAETLGTLLNQHSSASDISVQSRALHLRNLIRVIPDVNYIPAAIDPAQYGQLDTSDCALWSVSPTHIQYLKNMGVTSSMSVSIVVPQKLWGLIACHGSRTVRVPYEIREACKHVGAALAQQIDVVETHQRTGEAKLLEVRLEQLLESLAGADSAEAEIKRRLPEVLALVPASGVLICHQGTVTEHGLTPREDEALALCAFVRRQGSDRPYSTNALSRETARAFASADRASGVLAVTTGGEEPIEILWLRPEYHETIERAAKPNGDKGGREPTVAHSPHHAFGVWREFVKGRAQPWSDPEIVAVKRVRDGIERIRGRQRLNALQAKVIHLSRGNAMGAMASAIAHEINQPLTIIRNYATGLTRMLAQDSEADPELADILERISEQSLRAGEIVRQLRSLVSKEAPVLAPAQLQEIVTSACSMALLNTPVSGVTSRISIPAELVVLADNVQIQQVLMNLVKNALDAIADQPQGEVRALTISGARIAQGFIKLTVSNSGEGLPVPVRERLFSAFNSTKAGGLGIGLSICRTIVEAHGGRIWVDEPEPGGTAFSFTLQEAPASD